MQEHLVSEIINLPCELTEHTSWVRSKRLAIRG